MTLLKKAKDVKMHHNDSINDEVIELALAYIQGDIRIKQAQVALNMDGSKVYCRLARALKRAHEKGLLVINSK